jgi:hypothetical protein
MSLLFGNLTQDFVEFAQLIYQSDNNVPGAAEQLSAAAAHFRHEAGMLAIYLVAMGACLDHQSHTHEFNSVLRRGNLPLHVRVHVCVGVYQ